METLSDFVTDNPMGLGKFGVPGVVYAHKVKEFIVKLKEELKSGVYRIKDTELKLTILAIDKLAGEKLI